MAFYDWQGHRCAFEKIPGGDVLPLLLIHPIGVGLARQFWQPFTQQWAAREAANPIFNVDLLGCGESDMPSRPYRPEDWAAQLAHFLEEVVQEPVVLVVQGALLPVAVRLMALPAAQKVKGLVLSGPPEWRLMTTPTASWRQDLSWALFDSPLGNGFYRYARRRAFLRSFSQRQLFAKPEAVTEDWLAMLDKGAQDMSSRYAVFSFLAGFWRQDYSEAIARIQQPVMIVMGEQASSIDRTTAKQTDKTTEEEQIRASRKRLQAYLDKFPRAQGVSIPGRNVPPYEATGDFIEAIAPFLQELNQPALG